MNNYSKAKRIISLVRNSDKRLCYAVTAKGLWLDNPKERTIRVFKREGNKGGKRLANFTFNGRV